MNIKIIIATSAHADAIGTLIYRSHAISHAVFKDETWTATRKLEDYLTGHRHYWANKPDNERTWLAYLAEQAVGVVTVGPLSARDEFARPADTRADDIARTACIHGIHVEPDYLGRSIGQLLMSEAIAYLREQDYVRVTLLTDEANTRSRRFYEAGGWVMDGVIERPPPKGKTVRYCLAL